MKKYIEKASLLFEALPYAFVFIASTRFPFDTDLGWHLKQGEYFFKYHKILDVNILSTAMPNFHYVNASWLFDNLLYFVYHFFGFFGISLLGGLTVTLILFFFAQVIKLSLLEKTIIFPLVLLFGDLNLKLSVRDQTISILLISINIFLLTRFEKNRKLCLFLIPLLLAIWTNTHGEFVVGIVIIGIYTFTKFLTDYLNKRRVSLKENKDLIILIISSLLATLLNPYGYNIYRIVFAHFYNPDLLNKITEWASPLPFFPINLYLGILIVVFILALILMLYRKEVVKNLFFVLLTLAFLIPSIASQRYIWILIFCSIPLMAYVIKQVPIRSYLFQKLLPMVALVGLYAYVSLIAFPYKSFIEPNWKTYCIYVTGGCSPSAAEFIKEKDLGKNIFPMFEYGGWLIWNYPEIKPFIDGRMHVWKDENGYSGFLEHYNLEQGKTPIEDSRFNTVFINKKKVIYVEMQALVREGKWKIVYEDFSSVIYTRVTRVNR